MKKISFSLLFLTICTQSSYAGFADDVAKSIFQKKVDQLYASALSCKPLETDPKSSMTVKDWIKTQPTLPDWQMLANLEPTANEARTYARSIGGNDKTLHCLAGCFIAKKLDYKSAVLVGWMKELSDASDCSKKTSFEKKDYEVTIIGAKAARMEGQCDQHCKKK